MKILIVGLGSIAKKHIEAIRKTADSAEIFALRSSDQCSSIEGVTNLFSYDDLQSFTFDFAVISNPTSEHFTALNKLLDYDIPLFIEKPLFDQTGTEQQTFLDQIKLRKTITYVACNLRFLDCIQFIKSEIRGKRINEVNIYCGSYLPDWRPNVDFRKIYSANREMGGGVHIDLIHELDYTFWLFGEPLKTDSFFTNNSSLDISAYDYANYRWKYDSFTANVILNYFRRDAKRTLEIVCEEGTYQVDLLKNAVYYQNNMVFSSEERIQDTYFRQMDFFLKNILTGKDADFNSAFDAYKILNLCLH